jgi:hypothetical protein
MELFRAGLDHVMVVLEVEAARGINNSLVRSSTRVGVPSVDLEEASDSEDQPESRHPSTMTRAAAATELWRPGRG